MRLLLALLLAAPAEAARMAAPVVRARAVRVGLPAPLAAPQLGVPAPALAAPTMALPQVQAMAQALPQAEAPAAEAGVALSSLWDGGAKASMSDAVEGSHSAASALSPAELTAAVSRLGPVPAPRAALTKATTAGYWATLGLLSSLPHITANRVGPAIVGIVLGGMTGFMIQFFVGSMQRATAAPTAAPAAAPSDRTMEILQRVAKSMRMPLPTKVTRLKGDYNQAYVQGLSPSDYQLTLTSKLEQADPAELEAVLRHELAHVKHRDSLGRAIQMVLAPVIGGVALTGGIVGAPDAAILALLAAATLSYPFFQKLDEYQADQRAASAMGTAAPLASFFIRDSEDPKRAASAVGGKAFASEKGLRRAWSLAKAHVARVFSAHPAHDLRIARLGRLSAPPTGPPVRSIGRDGRAWVINGRAMPEMGFGSFKRTVVHPDDPDYVVKIFAGWGDGLKEMRGDRERSAVGERIGVTPRIVGSGVVNGLAYIVQERVHGAAESLPTKELTAKLAKAGLVLEDTQPQVLRKNILRGRTLSGGEGLWLVDPDVKALR